MCWVWVCVCVCISVYCIDVLKLETFHLIADYLCSDLMLTNQLHIDYSKHEKVEYCCGPAAESKVTIPCC